MNAKLNRNEKLQIIIQSGLQLIPYVGAPISTAYFSTKQEKKFKRIESFYSEFANRAQQTGDVFAPFESHHEESLMSIIEILNDKIEREHSDKKRKYFKNFLNNTLTNPTLESNYDERRIYLSALADMTFLEFQVLLRFHNQNLNVELDSSVDRSVILGAEARLEMYGFLVSKYQAITTSGVVL